MKKKGTTIIVWENEQVLRFIVLLRFYLLNGRMMIK